ncbi:MAG: hypothetical protein ACI9OE_002636 [Mariniflexile sp.]
MYFVGIGTKMDSEKGMYWLEKANQKKSEKDND